MLPLPRRFYPEKSNGICVHSKNCSAKPSINHFDTIFKRTTQERTSETISGFKSDFPKCRSCKMQIMSAGRQKNGPREAFLEMSLWEKYKEYTNSVSSRRQRVTAECVSIKEAGCWSLTFVQLSRNYSQKKRKQCELFTRFLDSLKRSFCGIGAFSRQNKSPAVTKGKLAFLRI